ncbi:acyl-CoA dehydrogenase family protein [Pseudomonas sp. NFACC13-1]|uniref:acyl-CoA dehydrogenase family protein n=1 Tax=Pseudomonas sp. NFACC13-1 TaxID=1566245 RepID=UPI000886EC81|nr:acyl-CoA dehydrogenase [Pseudomonas sp. NFACC13-1]SDB35029.1 Acyl-CoA dehydrogenase [Pseudomonas sp. NFACC13-1]
MDFSLTTEQRLLQDNLVRFFREATQDKTQGSARSLWSSLFDVLGLGELVPMPGAQPMHVEHALVMEALGQEQVRLPFLDAVMVCGDLLASAGTAPATELLEHLTQGLALPVLAWAEPGMRYDFTRIGLSACRVGEHWQLDGHKCMVRSAPLASHFLIVARTSGVAGDEQGVSLFLVPRNTSGLQVQECPTVDDVGAADLMLAGVTLNASALLGVEGQAWSVLERARDIAVAGLCAEARGALGQMLELTREHLGTRQQFGQRLSAFQVLQHRLVDMYLHLTKAGSAARLATLSLGMEPRRSLAASSAQVVVAHACRFIGQQAVQLHGAMGMCEVVGISQYFRRVTVLEREFGDRDFHLARYNALQRDLHW